MQSSRVIYRIGDNAQFDLLLNSKSSTTALSGVIGSSAAILTGLVAEKKGGMHVAVAPSKDEAGHFYNDLTSFWPSENVAFLPSEYKQSIAYGQANTSSQVQRTALLSRLKSGVSNGDFLIICTYPEALIEKFVGKNEIKKSSLSIKKNSVYSIAFIEELLSELTFQRVDFVYAPGQYSVRGGIVDIFSYSDNYPYRLDFFGDELESIRKFDANTQLSKEEIDSVEIFPKFDFSDSTTQVNWVALDDLFSEFGIDNVNYWVSSGIVTQQLIEQTIAKLSQANSPLIESVATWQQIENIFNQRRLITFREQFLSIAPEESIEFGFVPQISFNKNFDILHNYFKQNIDNGFDNYIVTQNQNQVERLETIFTSISEQKGLFKSLPASLHEGFVDNFSKIAFLTDHQIFERHHRYEIKSELPKNEALTIKELNALNVGDFVVHVDHGIGRFGGLLQSQEGGKTYEAVKLIYDNGDFILVNVHSLNKISKYRSGETPTPPKLNRLGHSAWQKVKSTAKSKIKDIVKELIELYAKRKNTSGFAFSPDSYLQTELEASFIYEDTPDQHKATEAVKADMERRVPMDRLVCGDVGFGKTEIAIRAAFKAACDGKQVAVLVPTTILSLQHFRTFSRRLKDFPVTIELLSRVKTTKEANEIMQRLKAGEIDILIGTHKILNKKIEFKDLGLLIVDEEQKFGVSSKERLRQFKESVDTLTLTATPIPRTLQFSLIGARDLSVINTPPPNRQPITTQVYQYNNSLLKEALEFELKRGGQVYFIHNKVESIEHMANIIRDLVPQARVAVGHGQMKPATLEKIITDFIYGEFDVLVSTTIVESGIDISNANTMIVNDAQNFGLSDLHQLRGRVGRTNKKAYCYLFVPESKILSDISRRRLNALEDFNELGSGFNIAMQDLDIRGAGNLLGGEQSGFIADIGYETYQKILNEAIAEFRDDYSDILSDQGRDMVENREEYIADCQFDVAYEAYIPDAYISNVNEKISIYRKIDTFDSGEELDKFRLSLVDRFGKLPIEVERLLCIVEIRKYAKYLGFEKMIIKNGYCIANFTQNGNSPYFRSDRFKAIAAYVGVQSKNFKLKQGVKSLLISIANVNEVTQAKEVIKSIYTTVRKQIINSEN